MEKYNKAIGKFGEDTAEKYLKKNKYKIIQRNYLIRGGEIDIIAQKGEYIIFVEVKTRSDNAFGTPAEAITFHKIQRMKKAAGVFMQSFGEAYCRFDVIEIYTVVYGEKFEVGKINHIENAFI